MNHFHTMYGIPSYGLEWSDDSHDTAEAAWASVLGVLAENWEQDRGAVLRDRHSPKCREVAHAYIRATGVAVNAKGPGRFFIPSLGLDDPGLTYGVTECTRAHLRLVKS